MNYNNNNYPLFVFDENRENLILKEKPYNQYKYDYIFSDFENPMIISSTLNAFIYPLIEAQRNILFLSFGRKSLCSSFLFGNNSQDILGPISLFNYTFQAIRQIMGRIKFDKILLELFKLINDKFIIDFKEIITDINKSIIDNINQHIKNGYTPHDTRNIYNTSQNEQGHMILRIKFFKFLSNNDHSKSQRQIEVIRTFSFIDIKDDEIGDRRSVDFFKQLIQSIANMDFNKFTEISSNLTDIVRQCFSLPNLFSFIFGLVDESRQDLQKSINTLNLLNICKNIDNQKFYNILNNMSISISRIENKAVKEEFQVLDLLYGEIIFYLEKTFKKLGNSFYNEVKDIEIKEKFFFIKEWLIRNKYDFLRNQQFSSVIENILGYINNRAQWTLLMKAKTTIMKLTENLKIIPNNNISNNRIQTSNDIQIFNLKNYTRAGSTSKSKLSSFSDEKTLKEIDKEMGYNKISIYRYPVNVSPRNVIKNQVYSGNIRKNKTIGNTQNYNNYYNTNNSYNNYYNNNYYNINNNYYNTNNSYNSKNNILPYPKNTNTSINKSKKDTDGSSSLGLSNLSCFDTKNNKGYFDFGSRSIGEFPTAAKSIESSFTQKIFKGLHYNFRVLFNSIFSRFTSDDEGCLPCEQDVNKKKFNTKFEYDKWVSEYKSLNMLETGINMEKISMINKPENKSNSNYSFNNKKYEEEINLHLDYDDKSFLSNNKKLNDRISKINSKMNNMKLEGNKYNNNIWGNNYYAKK